MGSFAILPLLLKFAIKSSKTARQVAKGTAKTTKSTARLTKVARENIDVPGGTGTKIKEKTAAGLASAKRFVQERVGISDKTQASLQESEQHLSHEIKVFEPEQSLNDLAQAALQPAKARNQSAEADIWSQLQPILTRAAQQVGFTQPEQNVFDNDHHYLTFNNKEGQGVKFVLPTNLEQPVLGVDLLGFNTEPQSGGHTCQSMQNELLQALDTHGLEVKRILAAIDHGDPKGVKQHQLDQLKSKQQENEETTAESRTARTQALHKRKVHHGR